MKKYLLSIFGFLMLQVVVAQPVFQSDRAARWADSLMADMPIEDKLGQLFMVAAYSNKGTAHQNEIEQLIRDEKIGGLIFFQGGPVRQARLTNSYQGLSEIPLLIGMDAEWGLAMRLDSTFKFPWPMTIGAARDSLLTYEVGLEMGNQCNRLGVHISFSPVVDINTNPDNPIINARSFGEQKQRVTTQSLALMRGLQDAGVLACAKHFPGHGDTDADSHKTLPTVGHNRNRLEAIELYPYKPLIDHGLASVMVAHLNVPAIDSSGKAASLSNPVVTRLLKRHMGFEGLVITDALNMKGVSAKYKPGLVDVEAVKAGNDILLFAEDVPEAKKQILKALAQEQITQEQIDSSVRKILMAKYAVGLRIKPSVELANLIDDLNTPKAELLRFDVMRKAQTLLINRDEIVPVKELTDLKLACVQMGKDVQPQFPVSLGRYAQLDQFLLNGNANDLLNTLSSYDLVIVGYHTSNANPWKSYNPTADQRQFLKKLSLQNRFILTLFSNPYVLRKLPEAELAHGLIMSYQNNWESNQAAAELIFGALQAQGRLPVSGSNLFDAGYGQQSKDLGRLQYSLPEHLKVSRNALLAIDSLVNYAIAQGATPGAQVLVAKQGHVFYHKQFGYHSYEKKQKTTENTVYDLASITKIAATLPFVMRMVAEGKLDLDAELGSVYPRAVGTNKEHLRIRDILAHQAGLQPWIPFYLQTLDNNQPNQKIYKTQKTTGFNRQVTQQLYMLDSYADTMYESLLASPLRDKSYKYSDLGYYMLKEIVEQNYGEPLDKLSENELYHPLGAYTTGFFPQKRTELKNIPPTEYDAYFRFARIQGTVHDQGAAMLGGVGGHAGLFSNANDLAKIMHMYLYGGKYGGMRYIDSTTLAEFTRCQFCESDNRRGAGFDKPQLSGPGPTCECVSMLSFGHTGFTGTIAWADPEEQIVYIFLSNRTWPDAENRKLIKLNTRSEIQQVIYNSLNTYP
jgi:beta-N-acetylhexosaminidase